MIEQRYVRTLKQFYDLVAETRPVRVQIVEAEEIISLLASRGNLIKRPFLIGDGIHLQGFKPELWQEAFEKGTGL